MSGKKHKDELQDLVTLAKSDISTHVKIRMLQTNPDWSNLITRKLLIETLTFMDGFGTCLKEYISPPIKKDDVKEFLKEEAFLFICRRIESDIK